MCLIIKILLEIETFMFHYSVIIEFSDNRSSYQVLYNILHSYVQCCKIHNIIIIFVLRVIKLLTTE